MKGVKTFLFLIVGAITFAACSRPSGCPSTFISAPKINQRTVNKFFAFKERKHTSYKEQSFFSMKTSSYNHKNTQKGFFSVSTNKKSANTEKNFFGTFSYSKNKFRDMDAFSSKPKKTRAQREKDHFASPYRNKNMSGSRDYFLMTRHSASNKRSKDFFSVSSQSSKSRASYNRTEENPFGNRSKKKQFKQREYQPDLFEDKVLWYKGKKRDKNMPKDSMGKEEGGKEKD